MTEIPEPFASRIRAVEQELTKKYLPLLVEDDLSRPLVECECDAPIHDVRPCRRGAVSAVSSPAVCQACLFVCLP